MLTKNADEFQVVKAPETQIRRTLITGVHAVISSTQSSVR